ncbi:MAG: glycosyltransferase 87 family protein [Pseudomonadota bacterium]
MAASVQNDYSNRIFLFASITCALVVTALHLFKYWPVGHAGNTYVFLHFALSAAMVAVWLSPRLDVRSLLILGVVLRLALIPTAPISSNDMERYLWDGAVALGGLDPYSVAPNSPLVEDLREHWATPPEHTKYPTLYPPAALSIFAASALGGPLLGVWIWKVVAALAGILSLFVMKQVAKHYQQERHLPLFALSPLLLLETGVGGHLDALLVLGLSLILYCHAKEKWGRLGLALGWCACVKFLPIVLLAPLFFVVPVRAFAKLLSTCLVVIVSTYAGALTLGYKPIGILPTFFEKWRFTSPFYQLLEYACGPEQVAFALAALALVGVITSCLAARKSALAGFAIVLSTPLLLSPVVFPWYLMTLVPLLALRPSVTLISWVSAVPLSYVVLNRWLAERLWEPAQWPVIVIGVVLITGPVLDFARLRIAQRTLSAPKKQLLMGHLQHPNPKSDKSNYLSGATSVNH